MSLFNKVSKSFQWGQHTVTIETGEIARQSSGAVIVNIDDTVVLATVVASKTAKAGQDYLAAFGTLMIYPNENQAVIPVEIMGDTTPEPDETFYLDVTHPVGGSFGIGVVTLTAVRTIINDDGTLFA